MSSTILKDLNDWMRRGGRGEGSPAIGHCAGILFAHPQGQRVLVELVLTIWNGFNDSTAVADWFARYGAVEVRVSHTLHDLGAEIERGTDPSGAKDWDVDIWFPKGHPATEGLDE